MNSHRSWTILTLCWCFVLFNVERLFPQVDIASFVYGVATLAGLAMLAFPAIRDRHFGLAAVTFGVIWILGRTLLGYAVDLQALPLAMTELTAIVMSQYLFMKVARHTDEFEVVSGQMLEVLRAASVPDVRRAEAEILEEIRRARRHERPLTFLSLTPGEICPDVLSKLVKQMARSLGREYLVGCISHILQTRTKSHDLAVRVGDQILMVLPETRLEQAEVMKTRLATEISRQLGVPVTSSAYAFGSDELTLSGVLDRMHAPANRTSGNLPDVFQLCPGVPQALHSGSNPQSAVHCDQSSVRMPVLAESQGNVA